MTDDPHHALNAIMPRLTAFARTLLGHREAARDLVQEAVARALTARQVPDDPPAYRAWLFRIVRNAAIDEIRKHRPEAFEDVPEPLPDLWRYEDSAIARLTVEQGMQRIAPAHREIIALIDIAGFSYAEAADLLGVPAGTVMSRVARARSALLAAIETGSLRVMPTDQIKSKHGH